MTRPSDEELREKLAAKELVSKFYNQPQKKA